MRGFAGDVFVVLCAAVAVTLVILSGGLAWCWWISGAAGGASLALRIVYRLESR